MPRGKGGGVKSSETARVEKSAKPHSRTCASVEMKDIEQTTAVSPERETGRSTGDDNIGGGMDNMSASSMVVSDQEGKNELPGKPKRLFVIAGSKKKDAKPNDSVPGANSSEDESQTNKNKKKAKTDVNTESCGEDSVRAKEETPRREFFDDEHPYEDPNLLVSNSKTVQPQDNKHEHSKTKSKKPKNKKNHKMDQNERPQSPRIKISKSTESIKAAVKAVKDRRPSVMSEHSGARSTFAFLVALLLSLIVFLSFSFLLHSHAVLSVAVAILVFTIVFMTLGFFSVARIKCLMLLFLPSLCSRGGKLALHVLLLYFVIKGPLCNTIGNIKAVSRSIECVNNQRLGALQQTTRVFQDAQYCVNNFPEEVTRKNRSAQTTVKCLVKLCSSVKDKLKQNCDSKNPRISQSLCLLAGNLSCNNSTIHRNEADCPTTSVVKAPCQEEFDEILGLLDTDGSNGDGCGFLEIFGMLLPLLILLLFHEAYNYDKSYQTYNNFHNYFLTGHFQCIDQSRSSCDTEAVLPLRKVELQKHVRPSTLCHLTTSEKQALWKSLKTYLVFLLFVLLIILADLYVYRMFKTKSDEAGSTNVSSNINITNMNKLLLQDENITSVGGNNSSTGNKTINTTMPKRNATVPNANATIQSGLFPYLSKFEMKDNVCLADVEAPGVFSKVFMPTLLSILLLIILLQAFFLRFQWYVCSCIYHSREKERVFYLYNKILEDRIQLVENCRNRMKCYHREMKTLNSLEPTRILVHQAKWLSKMFKFFHVNLRRCVICNDSEKPTFTVCHGADCSGVYCLECSFDIDKKCLYCDTELKKSLSVKKQDNAQDHCSKESLV